MIKYHYGLWFSVVINQIYVLSLNGNCYKSVWLESRKNFLYTSLPKFISLMTFSLICCWYNKETEQNIEKRKICSIFDLLLCSCWNINSITCSCNFMLSALSGSLHQESNKPFNKFKDYQFILKNANWWRLS